MLACQRDLFDIPAEIAYFDAAGASPLPREVRLAGKNGVAIKSSPWLWDGMHGDSRAALIERTRQAAAQLINAAPGDIAIVGAASYGIATAALNLMVPAGSRILLLENEHPSQSLAWRLLARDKSAHIDVVGRPPDGDWASAVLERIHRAGAPPISVAALTPLHWTDGSLVDLELIAPALRRHGAALVLDATQAAGILDIDVARLQPAFLVFPTYKWLLGPYSVAFLYAAPGRQTGRSLEQNPGGRHIEDADAIFRNAEPAFAAGARRYDKGECDWLVGLRMALAAFALISRLGRPAIEARLRWLTDTLMDRCGGTKLVAPDRRFRAPHILGLRCAQRFPQGMFEGFAAAGVFVSRRAEVLRVSPHIYNDENDINNFVDVLRKWTP